MKARQDKRKQGDVACTTTYSSYVAWELDPAMSFEGQDHRTSGRSLTCLPDQKYAERMHTASCCAKTDPTKTGPAVRFDALRALQSSRSSLSAAHMLRERRRCGLGHRSSAGAATSEGTNASRVWR